MATKQIYVGGTGPYLYDDASDIGISDDQVVTKGDMNLAIDLTEDQRELLAGLTALVGSGLIVKTGDSSFAIRELEGTANEIEVTYPNGFLGNPKIGLPSSVHVPQLSMDQIDLKQTAYAVSSNIPTHRVAVKIDGVSYFMLLQSA